MLTIPSGVPSESTHPLQKPLIPRVRNPRFRRVGPNLHPSIQERLEPVGILPPVAGGCSGAALVYLERQWLMLRGARHGVLVEQVKARSGASSRGR